MKKRNREPEEQIEEPETLDEYSVAPQEKKQHTAVDAVQADQGASFQSGGFTNNFEVPLDEVAINEAPISTQPVDIYYHIRQFFDDPPIDEQAIDEQHVDELHVDEAQVVDAHVVEEPVVDAHVVEEPVVDAHVVEEPVVEEPVVEEPVVEAPVVEAPVDEGRWEIIHTDTRRYHGDMIMIVWRCHTLTGEIRREDPRD
jgi:prolactin regulatory element-binding protein